MPEHRFFFGGPTLFRGIIGGVLLSRGSDASRRTNGFLTLAGSICFSHFFLFFCADPESGESYRQKWRKIQLNLKNVLFYSAAETRLVMKSFGIGKGIVTRIMKPPEHCIPGPLPVYSRGRTERAGGGGGRGKAFKTNQKNPQTEKK